MPGWMVKGHGKPVDGGTRPVVRSCTWQKVPLWQSLRTWSTCRAKIFQPVMSSLPHPSRTTVQVLDEPTVQTKPGLQELEQQATGDYWFDNRLSAVLRVPSAVVQGEFNYLLNPLHLDFAQIGIKAPVAFRFDERLFG